MRVVITVCTFAAAVLGAVGAPTLGEGLNPDDTVVYAKYPQYLRPIRSQYGQVYAAPCGAAQLPAYLSPAHAGFGGGFGGHGYGGGYGGSYGPHYRDDMGAEPELLSFSDMEHGMTEHIPMARYGGYGGGAGGAAGAGLAGAGQPASAPAGASGPAFGVFPGANVGGCNVPLLLSCSPSIVQGRLLKTQGYGGYAAALQAGNAYRGVEDFVQSQEVQEEHGEEQSVQSQQDNTNNAAHTSQ